MIHIRVVYKTKYFLVIEGPHTYGIVRKNNINYVIREYYDLVNAIIDCDILEAEEAERRTKMKKYWICLATIMAMVIACVFLFTGCNSEETVDQYRARVETALDDAKAGFKEALDAGDYTAAGIIRERYMDVAFELQEEMQDQIDEFEGNPSTVDTLRGKYLVLKETMRDDVTEMTEDILEMVKNIYGANSREYEIIQREYNEALQNLS